MEYERLLESDDGKELYLNGEYVLAIERWKTTLKSLDYILSSIGDNGEYECKIEYFKKKKVELLSNIALGCLKLDRYNETITYCSKALNIDNTSLKALLRISKACLLAGEYGKAIEYSGLGAELYPSEYDFKHILNQAKRDIKQYNKAEERIYRKMFAESPSSRISIINYIISIIKTVWAKIIGFINKYNNNR